MPQSPTTLFVNDPKKFTPTQHGQEHSPTKPMGSTTSGRKYPDILPEYKMTEEEQQLWDTWEEKTRQGTLTPKEARIYMDLKTLMDPRSLHMIEMTAFRGTSTPATPEQLKRIKEAFEKDRLSHNDEEE